MFEKTEGAMGQSRDTGNIGHKTQIEDKQNQRPSTACNRSPD